MGVNKVQGGFLNAQAGQCIQSMAPLSQVSEEQTMQQSSTTISLLYHCY